MKISIVIPTYKGRARLGEIVECLEKQTIGTESFEAIFVVNGPEDGSYEYLRSECQCKGKLRAKILKLSGKGAGYARNFGILASQGEYLTFLDDDDTIGPKYLETLLSKAGANRVVCAQMKDLDSLGNELNSTLADRLAVCLGSVKTLEEVPWVMGYNAAKLIPRGLVGSNRYVESLRSGEDVVFNARVMLPSSPEIWFVESTDQSYYFRHVRDGSLSRVGESFDFNVIQRFEVLKELVDIDSTPKLVDAQKSLIRSQLGFVKRYLASHPSSLKRVREVGGEYPLPGWIWEELNRGAGSNSLVISFCFPPFSDPSSSVVAKRIHDWREPVDVICNDMSTVRRTDWTLKAVSAPFVCKVTELDSPNYFSDWGALLDFGEKAKAAFIKNQFAGRKYEKLYSRALWAGSHLAGALIKLNTGDSIRWTAEFSDPLRFDVTGKHRSGVIESGAVVEEILSKILRSGLPRITIESVFDLIEAATVLLADELIFTNENQKRIIMSSYPGGWVELIEAKSTILPQSTLPATFYRRPSIPKAAVDGGDRRIRIGYFGSFYPNRGVGLLVDALNELDTADSKLFEFHCFVPDPVTAQKKLNEVGRNASIYVHPYQQYIPFLRTLSGFDILLVVDSDTRDCFEVNPFLPSKYSDYVGAAAKLWGFVQPGSPLSELDLDFKTELGNRRSIVETLKEVCRT
ncbi:hypothetical protein HMPREF3155_08375 [Corynebacterium sp. HMSC06D04]|uniref:glycosyltransferase n=1 Tax=unclassified Corynebacterium TaxID=2624378 RepID=UPI0008A62021|nr:MULTISPECIES: glycosyltransferase [unclassified Corynebacterium]OFT34785.1 hypothetical protein HMPREF3169_06030 [Corynebacterium sp. HMSC08C04]OFT50914.1 hypothetical protein HMPREF3155_08375 [Corynebacterium sp. HMSC06D04]